MSDNAETQQLTPAQYNFVETQAGLQSLVPKITTDDRRRAAEIVDWHRELCRDEPKLSNCTMGSQIKAILMAFYSGVNPLKQPAQAYIIPYGNEAQFQMSYQGLLKLLYKNKEIVRVVPKLVYPADEFREDIIEGKPVITFRDNTPDKTFEWQEDADGNKYLDYQGVILTTYYNTKFGRTTLSTFIPKEDIDKVYRSSKARHKGPWVTWPKDMVIKTALKKDTKTQNIYEADELGKAIQYDSWEEAGVASVNIDTGEINEAKKITAKVSEKKATKTKQAVSADVEEQYENKEPEEQPF